MEEQQRDGEDRTEKQGPFESKLKEGRERFLSELIEEVLATGEQAPEDFIRHFSPAAIMKALAEESVLRAQILIPTTGLKERMALRKSAEGAGTDLQMALEEEVTTATEVLDYFKPDNRVRFLPTEALWAFATETAFWEETDKSGGVIHQLTDQQREHRNALIAFILDRAIKNGLLTADQIVNPIMSGGISNTLQPEPLMNAVRKALEAKTSFTSELFLEAVPLDELIKHISTKDVWEIIVVLEVAVKQKLAPEPEEPATVPPKAEDKALSKPPATGEVPDGEWNPSELNAGIDKNDPPEITDDDIQLGPDDVEDVTDGDRFSTAESIQDAVAKAAENRGGEDAEIVIDEERLSQLPDDLQDAVDDEEEGDGVTRMMPSPLEDDSQIKAGAFAAARDASDVENRVSSPGNVSSSADLVKKSLVQRLRKAGFRLGSADTADIKHVIIQALAEIDPKTYGGSQALGLTKGTTSALAKSLIRNLREKHGDDLADAVLNDLQTLKAASVVVQNPDPNTRKPDSSPRASKAPRPPRKKK
jgi:hypothetical protein